MLENGVLVMRIDREHMTKANLLRGHPIYAFSHRSTEKFDLITKTGLQMQSLFRSKCLLIKKDLGM